MNPSLSHDEELVRRLPLPLAQLYRRAHNAKTALERHLTSYYLWEAGLKLLGAVTLVEYAELEHTDEQLQQRLQNLARPSLGHWWEFLRRLVPILADKDSEGFGNLRTGLLGPARGDLPRCAGLDAALRELLENKSQARATVRVTELIDRLIAYRNRELGHGAAGQRPVDFYEKMSRALLGAAAEFFGKFDVGLGRPLLFVGEVRRQSSGAWLVERFDLGGENARRLESLDWPADDLDTLPHPERVYLEASGVRDQGSEVRGQGARGQGERHVSSLTPGACPQPPSLRSLHPLVIFDRDTGEFLFLNARRGKQRTEYLSYTTGRVVDRQDLGDEQRALMIRILGLEVSPEQTRAWALQSQAEEGDTARDNLASGDTNAGTPRTIGEFELLSELGRGGMGVVYRAWQPSLDRQVALKCLMRSGDPKSEARFAREIRALGSVEHPNLIKIFTSGSDKDQWFYAMEIVEGATLGAVCDRFTPTVTAADVNLPGWQHKLKSVCSEMRQAEKPLSTPGANGRPAQPEPAHGQAAAVLTAAAVSGSLSEPQYYLHMVKLVRQVAEAAHALHQVGIIHRDIKPGNIMVNTDGSRAVLMDLGLAQLADDIEGKLTRTRQFVGTLRYASPEQILAVSKLDARTDVYSLGATLWELLTLRPLFGADENTPTPELMQCIQFQEPGQLRKFNPRIPADLEAIVSKCLEKSPGGRYGSCRELADDLDRFLEGRPVKARPVGGLERAWRWCRRRPAIAGLGAALLFSVIAGFALVTWKWLEAERNLMLVDEARVKAQNLQLTAEKQSATLAVQKKQLEVQKDQQLELLLELKKNKDELLKKKDELEKTLGDLKKIHYFQTIPVAYANPSRAEELINPLAPHLRGWEWQLLKRRHKAPFLTWKEHTGNVFGVAFSPDGRWLASAGEDRYLFLRSGYTGEIVWKTREHPKSIYAVAFSPDSKLLATGSTDNLVRIWDLAAKKTIFTFKKHTKEIVRLAFHPKEPWVASHGMDKKVHLWNYRSGDVVESFEGAGGLFSGVAFSSDGNMLAFSSLKNGIVVRDLAGRKTRWTLQGHTERVNQVAFSPDGKLLASASQDKSIMLWDLETGKSVKTLRGHTNFVTAVAFHPAGKLLASTAWDLTVRLWDVERGQELRSFLGHTHLVLNLAFAPDGNYLASVGADHVENLWEVDWPQDARILKGQDAFVPAVVFHPDNRHVVSAGGWDQNVRVWDALTGKFLFAFEPQKLPLGSLAVSSDGKRLAAGTGIFGSNDNNKEFPIFVWDWNARHKITRLPGHAGTISRLAFRPNRPHLASASKDKTVKVWDLDRGVLLFEITEPAEVWTLAYGPDGNVLASAGKDRLIHLWDADTGKALGVLKGHGRGIRALAFHPSQSLLASGSGELLDSDGEILLWNVADRKLHGRLVGHGGAVTDLAFHPDGTRLVSSSEDFTVKIWDPSTLLEILTLRQHDYWVDGVAFSPDGALLASAGHDKKIVLWDGTPTSQLFRLSGHTSNVNCAAFSPDGAALATTSWDRSVRLWSTTSGVQLASFPFKSNLSCAKFDPVGKTLIVAAKGIHVLELPDGQTLKTFDQDQNVYFVAFNPRAPLLASTGADKSIKLWDARSWNLRQTLPGHDEGIHSMAFSPDGQLLASAGKDKTVKIWDVAQGKDIMTLTGHEESVQEVAFHADGVHLASASQDRTVRIWNVKTGEAVHVLVGHLAKVWSVAFHPEGDLLLSADNLGVVKVWDFASGKETATLRAHAGSIPFITYSGDGKLFATVSSDNTAQLWSRLDVWQEERRAHPFFLPRVPEGTQARDFPADPFEKLRWRSWFDSKSRTALKQSDWDDADLLLALLLRLEPGKLQPLLERGQTLARLGKYAEAGEHLAQALELDSQLDPYWSALACLRLKVGAGDEYRRFCQGLTVKYQTDSKRLVPLAWTCALGETALSDLSPLLKKLDDALKERLTHPRYLGTLGALQYRAGKWRAAADTLAESVLRQRRSGVYHQDLFFLAMTHHRLGHDKEARQYLADALRGTDNLDSTLPWQEVLELQWLRDEAAALIGKQ